MKLSRFLHAFGFPLILCMAFATGYYATGAYLEQLHASPLERAKKNVIRMTNGDNSCSGTIVNATTIITAAHCVPPTGPIILMTPGGIFVTVVPPMHTVQGGVELTPGLVMPYIDGATMHGDFSPGVYTEMDENDGDVFVAEKVIICGYPLFSDKLRCTEAEHARGEDGRLLNRVFHALFKTISIPGQSGGAVFSMHGKLIGLVSAGTEDGYTEVVSTAGLLSQEPKN